MAVSAVDLGARGQAGVSSSIVWRAAADVGVRAYMYVKRCLGEIGWCCVVHDLCDYFGWQVKVQW